MLRLCISSNFHTSHFLFYFNLGDSPLLFPNRGVMLKLIVGADFSLPTVVLNNVVIVRGD